MLEAVDLCSIILLRDKIALIKAEIVSFSHLNQQFST